MRIDKIEIENYGVLNSSHTFNFSSSDLSLIYGPNEAGKTTLLRFIRDVLFGTTAKSASPYALQGDSVGGRVHFTLDDGRTGTVERIWRKKKREFYATLSETSTLPKETLDEEGFGRLFKGVDRSLYENYFGFSREELKKGGESLKAEGLDDLIYGMEFGSAERYSSVLADLKKIVEGSFGSNWKGSASKCFKELEASKEKRYGARNTDEYNRTREERERERSALAEAIRERTLLELEEKDVDRLRAAWKCYALLTRNKECRVALLSDAPFDRNAVLAFSLDAATDYRTAAARCEELEQQLDEARNEIACCDSEIARLEKEIDPRILERAEELTALDRDCVGVAREYRRDVDARTARIEEREGTLIREAFENGLIDENGTAEELARRLDAPVFVFDLDSAKSDAEDETDALNALRNAKKNRENCRAQRDDAKARLDLAKDKVEALGGLETSDDAARELAERGAAFIERANKLESEIDRRHKDERALAERARELVCRALGAERFEKIAAQCSSVLSRLARLGKAEGSRIERELAALNESAEPSRAELETLRAERDKAREDAAEVQRELEDRERRRENARAELERLNVGDASTERANAAREKRERYWEEIKAYCLDPAAAFVHYGRDWGSDVARAELLEQAEDAIADVDRLAELRFQRAEAIGRSNILEDELAKYKDDSQTLLKLNAANARAAASVLRLKEFWSRAGLAMCEGLSFEASFEWLDAWKSYRADRESFLAREAETLAEIARAERPVTEALERAAASCAQAKETYEKWGSVAADLNAFERVSARSALVKELLKEMRRRASERERARDELNAADAEYARRAQEFERFEAEIASLKEELKTFAERRLRLCEKYELDAANVERSAALVKIFELLKRLRDDRARLVADKEKLEQDGRRDSEFDARATKLARALGVSRRGDPEDDVARWREDLDAAQEKKKALEICEQKRALREAELDSLQERSDNVKETRRALEARVGVSRDRMEEFIRVVEELREIDVRIGNSERELRAALAVDSDDDFERALDSLRETSQEELDARKENCERAIVGLKERVSEREQNIGRLDERVMKEEEKRDALRAREEYEAKVVAAREIVDGFAPVYIAYQTLKRKQESRDQAFVPKIVDEARAIFREATGYVGLEPYESKDERLFRVWDEGRDPKNISDLSEGTREALYLALRLSRVKLFCENSESLPIFADDILVNCDDERVEKILGALARYVSPKRQIVLQTHHRATRDAFERTTKTPAIELLSER